jgi:hypothetical protein
VASIKKNTEEKPYSAVRGQFLTLPIVATLIMVNMKMERTRFGFIMGHYNLSFGFICHEIQGNSEPFFDFGAEGNIGTSILLRRKVKKKPEELEYLANKPETQV